jgi:hypothetical protein
MTTGMVAMAGGEKITAGTTAEAPGLSPVGDKVRRRRTQAEIATLEHQIVDVLALDHPQSVRHVYYRMTDPRLAEPVAKTEQGYAQIKDRMKRLRRRGVIPYGWISDTTRTGYFVNTYGSAADFLRANANRYRSNLWANASVYCEVWVESRSIAGVIRADCEELAVSLYPAGGFSSITFAYEAATYINAEHDGRELVVFYIGDYDPAGVLIDRSIEREIREHLDPDVDMRFLRLGITHEQVEQYELPTKPRKEKDRRAPHITATVEAEAMPAGILRAMLRDAIEALLPADALEVTKVAEASERDFLLSLADHIDAATNDDDP